MKFKKLYEAAEKPKFQYEEELANYIYNKYLDSALDNIALSAAADLYWYDADWAAEEVTYYSQEVFEYLQKAARACAEDLLYNYIDDFGTDEEEYDESLKESIVGNAKNWLIDKEGKSPKEAEKIINNSSVDELEKIALKWINKNKNESLKETFISNDKRWKLVEEIKKLVDEGHIDKDNLIDKLLQWFYKDPTFPSFVISANIFHEEEVNDILGESLKEDVNDFYKEEPSEDFDASEFIGRPLKDFLKTIDHRTKINISSEDGYDEYGDKGNTSGLSGLAHDTGWYLADKKITDIKIPKDKRFYSYSIFIEGLDNKKNLKEEFKIGQKVLYDGKETIIKDIEKDPRYGIDLLIKNPNWDGKDERFAYIWVGNNVEKLN